MLMVKTNDLKAKIQKVWNLAIACELAAKYILGTYFRCWSYILYFVSILQVWWPLTIIDMVLIMIGTLTFLFPFFTSQLLGVIRSSLQGLTMFLHLSSSYRSVKHLICQKVLNLKEMIPFPTILLLISYTKNMTYTSYRRPNY